MLKKIVIATGSLAVTYNKSTFQPDTCRAKQLYEQFRKDYGNGGGWLQLVHWLRQTKKPLGFRQQQKQHQDTYCLETGSQLLVNLPNGEHFQGKYYGYYHAVEELGGKHGDDIWCANTERHEYGLVLTDDSGNRTYWPLKLVVKLAGDCELYSVQYYAPGKNYKTFVTNSGRCARNKYWVDYVNLVEGNNRYGEPPEAPTLTKEKLQASGCERVVRASHGNTRKHCEDALEYLASRGDTGLTCFV